MGSYSKNSRKIRTLNSVQQLRDVTFGHKFPRHGLKLLHWLANDVIKFDNNGTMRAKPQYKPSDSDFGFHPFHNAEGILPHVTNPRRYFEVGNLHAPGAQSLPFREDESWNRESNTDRIILSVDSNVIIGVYITEHAPNRSSFSPEGTYHLSSNLIRSIKGVNRENFLKKAGYDPGEKVSNESYSVFIPEESSDTPSLDEEDGMYLHRGYRPSPTGQFVVAHPRDNDKCCCIIL